MGNIQERLDQLKEKIQTEDFLLGKGLSNEVNIQIFTYDPADEMIVHHFWEQVKKDNTLPCNLIECNLYKVFISICEQKKILSSIPKMEEKKGKDFLLKQLRNTANEKAFIEKIQYPDHQVGKDVILLTGVGDVFPFMRVHMLLEALQPYFSDIPVLVMYPGQYDGHYLKLFNLLKPNDYYRAFNIV